MIERLEKLENVNLDGCTPFNLPEENCKHDIVGNVYNGTEREFEDTDLQPYSGENDHCSNWFLMLERIISIVYAYSPSLGFNFRLPVQSTGQ